MMLAVALSACGTSGESASSEPTDTPISIDDLKASPDQISRQINNPSDLGVPEKWDLITDSLSGNLTQILKVSFVEPGTWKLTSDEDAVGAVVAGFGSIGEKNAANLAESLLAKARGDAVDGERIATQYASTFAPATQPPEVFIYKLTWDASVDEDAGSVKVTAVMWAGYEVDGRAVIVGRQFSLTGIDQGPNVGYSMSAPVEGGYYDVCSAVVDGVLAPIEDTISEEGAEALRAEFADRDFRPLRDAIGAIAEADGTDDAEGNRRQRVEDCLAGR